MVEKAIAPDYALSSHVAALGMEFSMNSALPEAYRNGAFVGEHGSWNRTFFNGYKVVYIPFENGAPSGKAQDVVTGFLDGEQARGRPVGVGVDGTGALLIADDAGNTVWRVAAADGSVSPQPVGTAGMTTSALGAGQGGNAAIQDGTQSSAASNAQPPAAPAAEQQSVAPAGEAAPAQQPAQTQIAPAVLPPGTVQDNPTSTN
jgi:predicted extracellular nuclease